MEKLSENEYLILEVDTEMSIYKYTWKSESKNLTLEQFVLQSTMILETYFTLNTQNVIGNDLNFYFIIVPEVQLQLNKAIVTKLNNTSLKKFAHIYSSDLIIQLASEQLFDENNDKTYQDKYFDNLQDAINWLKL